MPKKQDCFSIWNYHYKSWNCNTQLLPNIHSQISFIWQIFIKHLLCARHQIQRWAKNLQRLGHCLHGAESTYGSQIFKMAQEILTSWYPCLCVMPSPWVWVEPDLLSSQQSTAKVMEVTPLLCYVRLHSRQLEMEILSQRDFPAGLEEAAMLWNFTW